MEFYEELLLTALFALLLAFLIGRIAADSGPRRRLALDPIQEEEEEEEEETEKPEGKPRAGGPTGVVEVEEERSREERLERGEEVGSLDEEKENITEKSSSEVDLPSAEEPSAKNEDDRVETGRIDDDLVKQEGRFAEDKEDTVESCGEDAVGKEDVGGSLLHGEDEWEGIERSQLEKLFGVAAEYVGSKKGGDAMSKLSNEEQMQLYGLHKVATEGPCRQPQPMALKVSARAKWHAWQRLGNMNPEAAMEEYISLLTEGIPGWMAEKSGEEAKAHDGNDPLVVEVSRIGQLDSKSSHCKSKTEILVEDSSSIGGVTDNVDTGPKLFKQGLTKIFLFNLLSPTRLTF